MREVDDALDFMKDEFQTRMETCDQRQRQFEQKQREMKESVYKFEKVNRICVALMLQFASTKLDPTATSMLLSQAVLVVS
jgi:hypothetical protein